MPMAARQSLPGVPRPRLNKASALAAVLLLGAVLATAHAAGEMIFLRDFGGDEVAYLVIPDQQPQLGVVVAPDGHGLDARVKALCDALAAKGYLALAVDLTNGRTVEDAEAAAAAQRGIQPEAAVKALRAGLLFYEKSPRFRMERTAVVTLGGSAAYGAALAREKAARSVVALSLLDPPVTPAEGELAPRVQVVGGGASLPGPGFQPALPKLVDELHAFWSSEATRKNFFQRLVD